MQDILIVRLREKGKKKLSFEH